MSYLPMTLEQKYHKALAQNANIKQSYVELDNQLTDLKKQYAELQNKFEQEVKRRVAVELMEYVKQYFAFVSKITELIQEVKK